MTLLRAALTIAPSAHTISSQLSPSLLSPRPNQPSFHHNRRLISASDVRWQHQENVYFTFGTFSCFYYFFQAKKVNFLKVRTAWKKPSPTLFHLLSRTFSHFFLQLLYYFTTTLLFSHHQLLVERAVLLLLEVLFQISTPVNDHQEISTVVRRSAGNGTIQLLPLYFTFYPSRVRSWWDRFTAHCVMIGGHSEYVSVGKPLGYVTSTYLGRDPSHTSDQIMTYPCLDGAGTSGLPGDRHA